MEPGQQFEQEHSGCVEDDLLEISEDHSTESYSSQAWSVQSRWQLFLWCEGQGRDGYSREHELMVAGFRQCRYLIRKGKMFVKYEAKVASRLSNVYAMCSLFAHNVLLVRL